MSDSFFIIYFSTPRAFSRNNYVKYSNRNTFEREEREREKHFICKYFQICKMLSRKRKKKSSIYLTVFFVQVLDKVFFILYKSRIEVKNSSNFF